MKDPEDPTQLVFRALSHPIRRGVMEDLLSKPGLSMTELMARHSVSRQTFAQHLQSLEDADLVRHEFAGRERLHYLNVVPLYAMSDEWLSRFVNDQGRALLGLRARVERSVRAKDSKSA